MKTLGGVVTSVQEKNHITKYEKPSPLPFIINREYRYSGHELSNDEPAYIALANTEIFNLHKPDGVCVVIPKELETGKGERLFTIYDDQINPEMIIEVSFSAKIGFWDLRPITRMYKITLVNGLMKIEPYEINKEVN